MFNYQINIHLIELLEIKDSIQNNKIYLFRKGISNIISIRFFFESFVILCSPNIPNQYLQEPQLISKKN